MMRRQQAFTLIELVVVLALAAIVMMIAAPAFGDFILTQRLKSINASLVTDMQFARSEAASRGVPVIVSVSVPGSGSTMSCYTIYTDPSSPPWGKCDCTRAAGLRCASTSIEIKTVQIASSLSVTVAPPSGEGQEFAYDAVNGRISLRPDDTGNTLPRPFRIDTYINTSRKLRTSIGVSGRPQVCLPSGAAVSGYLAC